MTNLNIKRGVSVWALLLLNILALYSQKYDYNWVFRSRWPDTANVVTFSFDSAKLLPTVTPERRRIGSTNLSLSNIQGDFLLSSNGCEMWDENFDILENSRPLNPGEAFSNLCRNNGKYEAGHQSMAAIPDPANEDHFLIFHEQHAYTFDSTGRRYIDVGAILLTKVDISTDPPTVIFKNQDVVRDTMTYGGGLVAVKHENLKDWWLLVPLRDEPCFYKFLITQDGIENPLRQCIGRRYNTRGEGGSQSSFTHDGRKLVRWHPLDGINIFDFDRATGELSNFIDIPFTADSILFGGMSISPNNRFLYVTTLLDMYQFDLEANDVGASRVHIASYDGHQSPGSCTFAHGQLAPDCKIYWSSAGACTELHVIHQPNEKGLACDFRQHDFKRVSNSNSTMPYFPNYRLGTGEVCDTNLMVSVHKIVLNRPQLKVWPNPTSGDRLYIAWPDFSAQAHISLVNTMGQVVMQREVSSASTVELDVSGLHQGVYTVVLSQKNGSVLAQQRVVVGR
jgi:hypothetical protein